MKPVMIKGTLNIWPLTARYPPYDSEKQRVMKGSLKFAHLGEEKVKKTIMGIVAIIIGYHLYKSGKLERFINKL